MPKVYRAMKEEDGMPKVGASATTLGVRVPGDIEPDEHGIVHPGTGGMSVAPRLENLPTHRIPRRLAHLVAKAKGDNALRVWCVGTGGFASGILAAHLCLRVDRPVHGLVEPDTAMAVADYVAALESTQTDWRIEEWT